MRCRFAQLVGMICLIGLPGGLAFSANGAEGRIIKVLPQFVDPKGQAMVSPSLYDRDAYQKYLRMHPAKRSGMRFAVQWKARTPATESLKLRVELRGIAEGNLPKETIIEETVRQHHWFSHWTSLTLTGDAFKEFGEVTAWRATLWDGDKLLGEQKSFLW
jgi:hypothetical protein